MLKKILLCSLLLCFHLTCIADQLIIEPDMGRKPILDAITYVNHSLKLVMYGFTDKTLLNAIIQNHQLGKTTKIILEQTPYRAEQENLAAQHAFFNHNIDWQGKIPPFQLIHQKTLIVDDKKAIIMTFNFTNATFKNARNFGLLIDDPKLVRDIGQVFSADWNHVAYFNQNKNLIYSPDDSRSKLSTLLNSARSSLKIYAQSLTDYQIVGMLAKIASRGVKVQIITSAKSSTKQSKFLLAHGVEIYYLTALFVHAKAIIIDDKIAILGSINLTRPSLDKNRELSIIINDNKIIRQLKTIFENDRKLSQSNHARNRKKTKNYLKRLQDLINNKHAIRHALQILEKISVHYH